MKKIAILSSHNGSGFDALYEKKEFLNIDIVVVISNNTEANVLKNAKLRDIDNFIVNGKSDENPDEKIYKLLKNYNPDFVFLSGYMKKISPLLIQNFKLINCHPSLLPKYGGKGMYGRNVHEAVIKNNEKISGVTIHRVNENYDEGEIVLQKTLNLEDNENIESLETKIKNLEKETIVEAFKKLLT